MILMALIGQHKLPYLIECCLFWANEAPTELCFLAIWIGDWQANVEYLTIILNIRIIAIDATFAREIIGDITPDRCGITWERHMAQAISHRIVVIVFFVDGFFCGGGRRRCHSRFCIGPLVEQEWPFLNFYCKQSEISEYCIIVSRVQ